MKRGKKLPDTNESIYLSFFPPSSAFSLVSMVTFVQVDSAMCAHWYRRWYRVLGMQTERLISPRGSEAICCCLPRRGPQAAKCCFIYGAK